jgi:hypothetical protein
MTTQSGATVTVAASHSLVEFCAAHLRLAYEPASMLTAKQAARALHKGARISVCCEGRFGQKVDCPPCYASTFMCSPEATVAGSLITPDSIQAWHTCRSAGLIYGVSQPYRSRNAVIRSFAIAACYALPMSSTACSACFPLC